MSQGALLRQRRFAPFFGTQFLGAFNDNFFKQAVVILFTQIDKPDSSNALSENALPNLASMLLMLPFFIFSATAGQLAEKTEKSWLMQAIKLLEIVLMIGGAATLILHSPELALILIFMMGLQSALFGPVKFAYLPQAMGEFELVGANGLVEMGTNAAVLMGFLAGGLLILAPSGELMTGIGVIVVACLGYFAARNVPRTPSPVPELQIDWNIARQTWLAVSFARERRPVWLSVLGNSWFWAYGALVLAQIPNFNVHVLHGDASVVVVLMLAFTVGVGIGSLLCERLSGGHIELGLVPFGSLGISFFGIDLFLASEWYESIGWTGPEHLLTVSQLLGDPRVWRMLIDMMFLGLFGGLYSVPLNALIQERSDPTKRSRIIAGNNIMNALFIVVAGAAAMFLLDGAGFSIPELFLIAAIVNLGVAGYIYSLLPEFLFRFLIWILMNTMYRLKSSGLHKIPREGPAVLVCNHVSFVDAMILASAVRRQIRFVMWYKIYEIPMIKWLFGIARAIPIASRRENKPGMVEAAMREVASALEEGELVCIFPEGGLTYTGEMQEFRPGVERIVETTPVPVYPMALRGLWGSWFSRSGGPAMKKRPRRFRSHIELVVGDPIDPEDAKLVRLYDEVKALRGDKR